MKNTTLLLTVVALIYISCKTVQPVTFQFPAEMNEQVKKSYTEQCEKGKLLYEQNCASCHTIKKRGKELLPNFTEDQLQGYHIRGGTASHETNVSEERVDAEQLVNIVLFLTYRTKNSANSYTPKITVHKDQK